MNKSKVLFILVPLFWVKGSKKRLFILIKALHQVVLIQKF